MRLRRHPNVLHSFSLFVTLCLFWLLLSGLFTPFLHRCRRRLGAGRGVVVRGAWT